MTVGSFFPTTDAWIIRPIPRVNGVTQPRSLIVVTSSTSILILLLPFFSFICLLWTIFLFCTAVEARLFGMINNGSPGIVRFIWTLARWILAWVIADCLLLDFICFGEFVCVCLCVGFVIFGDYYASSPTRGKKKGELLTRAWIHIVWIDDACDIFWLIFHFSSAGVESESFVKSVVFYGLLYALLRVYFKNLLEKYFFRNLEVFCQKRKKNCKPEVRCTDVHPNIRPRTQIRCHD